MKHFSPEDLTVKVLEDFVEIHGKHNERQVSPGALLPRTHLLGALPSPARSPRKTWDREGAAEPSQGRGPQGRPLGDCPPPRLLPVSAGALPGAFWPSYPTVGSGRTFST